MANPKRQPLPRKGTGLMENEPDILEALKQMDLDGIKQCVAIDPQSVHKLDARMNNVMHICVAGGAAIRARHIMEYFLTETNVSLLWKNDRGQDPLDLADYMGDREASELLEPFWDKQLNARFPLEESPKLTAVPGKPRDPQP